MKLHVLTTMTSAVAGVRRQFVPIGDELTHHDLRIDEVLGTTETDKSDFQDSMFQAGGRASNRITAIADSLRELSLLEARTSLSRRAPCARICNPLYE